jgi:hypothetical protein
MSDHTDFRALCAELLEWAEHTSAHYVVHPDVILRARAALAQPEPVAPTVMEILALSDEIEAEDLGTIDLVRRALARWGNYPVKPDSSPVPAAERWPEFSDCDPQERVWAWNPFLDHWKLSCINRSVHTHWLPANALPVPADD